MKSVYYTCPFVPEELIVACGGRPRRCVPALENGALSQTEGMCTFTEAWLGTLLNKAAAGEDFVAVFTTSCDQMRRAYDLFDPPFNRPAFLLHVPTTETAVCLSYYEQQLERLKRFLCSVTETEFDTHRIPPAQPATPVDCQPGIINIAITGGPVCESILGQLQDILSQSRAQIVFDLSENAMTARWNPADSQSPPETVADIAKAYFELPAIWKRPNHPFYRQLTEQAAAHRTDGIILFRHVFCDLWHSAAYEIKNNLPQPVLEIDLDGKPTLSESAVSRIQAFLEMLA
ncbi:MAG: 2-hydroxyacyl-CoA dehydratase [Planctomycetota bacterium]|jgi:benzoyl-CoA reductase/2-hydroxyglutaryl-CoA dehydratase subunit BcrC/BadD/HgdB